MTETDFYRNIVYKQLSSFGMLWRVENALNLGTADVAYCLKFKDEIGSGWLETKKSREWPKRFETPLRFNHYTLDQVIFAERWNRAGGRACMLAQVENDFLIVPAWNMRKIFKGVNKTTFISLSVVHGQGVFPTGRILKWLTE